MTTVTTFALRNARAPRALIADSHADLDVDAEGLAKVASTPARHRPCRESKNGHLLAQFEDVIRRAVGAVEAGLAMACSGTRKVAWPEP